MSYPTTFRPPPPPFPPFPPYIHPMPPGAIPYPPRSYMPVPSLPRPVVQTILPNPMKTDNADKNDFANKIADEQKLRSQDKQWVDSWLKGIGAHQRSSNQIKPAHSLTISDYKKTVSEIILLNEKLERISEELKDNVDEKGFRWSDKFEETISIQNRIDYLKNKFEEKECKADFLKKTQRSRKKKERRKRVSRAIYLSAKNAETEREVLDQKISQWQKSFIVQQKEEKKVLAIQKSVDFTLAEVKNKINETQQSINLIDSLKKLRHLRYKNALNEGANIPPENDIGFNNVTTELLELLNGRMKIYEAERHSLKVMLDLEKEEDVEKKIEENKKKKNIMHKKKVTLTKRLLFGKQTVPSSEDPVYPFYTFYDGANTSFESLISTRNEWDKFMVPEGTPGASQIPVGWVNPSHPSDTIWADYLISTRKNFV